MIRGFECLTNLAVRCPLPNPLPRGEGIRFLKIRESGIKNQMVGKPENVRVCQPDSLSRREKRNRLLKIRGLRIENRMVGKPENVRARQPNPLSPWERARERAGKPQACLFNKRYSPVRPINPYPKTSSYRIKPSDE
ncbi:hypothetical protein NEIPOLOT_02048 [Neisseria polysaccharea ATCC 43768]|nr:hypothetical protein NEIPOLOT_02048 [Neisseria polysaccharea ATCC 43768]